MPVLNLISSIAVMLEGSLCAKNKRLPRLNSGSTRCFSIKSLLIMSLAISSVSNAAKSNSGSPNSVDAKIPSLAELYQLQSNQLALKNGLNHLDSYK